MGSGSSLGSDFRAESQNNCHSKRHDREKKNPREKRLSYFEIKKQRLKNWISYLKNPLMQPIYGSSTKKTKKLLNALSSPAQVDIKILKENSEQDEIKLERIHQQRAREHWSGQIIAETHRNLNPPVDSLKKHFQREFTSLLLRPLSAKRLHVMQLKNFSNGGKKLF